MVSLHALTTVAVFRDPLNQAGFSDCDADTDCTIASRILALDRFCANEIQSKIAVVSLKLTSTVTNNAASNHQPYVG